MLFRNATLSDLEGIYQLAQSCGVGITTLSKDKVCLEERLHVVERSFNKTDKHLNNEYYLFVLQELDTGQLVGTAGIEASIGQELPFYSYKLAHQTRVSRALGIRTDYETLNLVNDYQGSAELCTLYLSPEFRKRHYGLLLSRARFLFMAEFPARFAPRVIAEMRGVSDAWGESPFWNNVGKHFFQMSFAEADHLTMLTDKQFIADLMPRHPVYVPLLSDEAQAAIGQPHASTISAMKILQQEGFQYKRYVDIFDAGPTLEVSLNQIRTITQSKRVVVSDTVDEIDGVAYLLAKMEGKMFRATLAPVVFQENHASQEQRCILDKKTAAMLHINVNDVIRLSPFVPGSASLPLSKKTQSDISLPIKGTSSTYSQGAYSYASQGAPFALAQGSA